MAKVVTAIFRTRSSATLAVEDLLRRGFHQEDISMVLTDTLNGREFAMAKETEACDGAVIGAGILAPICAILAALSASGHLPAFGTGLTAAGPGIALLAGLGLGGLIGLIVGYAIGLSLPKYEAKFFSFKPHSAGILVGVYVDESLVVEAKKVLEAAGGAHIGDRKVLATQQFRQREEIEQEHAMATRDRIERGPTTIEDERL